MTMEIEYFRLCAEMGRVVDFPAKFETGNMEAAVEFAGNLQLLGHKVSLKLGEETSVITVKE